MERGDTPRPTTSTPRSQLIVSRHYYGCGRRESRGTNRCSSLRQGSARRGRSPRHGARSSGSGRCATSAPVRTGVRQTAVAREQDTLVRPGRGNDLQLPTVSAGGVQSSSEKPGDAHPASGDRSQSRTPQSGIRVGAVVLWARVTVPCDLLPRDGVEETVTVVRDDHYQVFAGVGVRGESDTEKSADRGVRDAPPGLGGLYHRGGEEPLLHRLLVGGEPRLRVWLLDRRFVLRPLRHATMIHAAPDSSGRIRALPTLVDDPCQAAFTGLSCPVVLRRPQCRKSAPDRRGRWTHG
ncbi:hypothetical protein FBY22_0382 [Streptomyces sp. SLBN-31]|nr:hypothetical protein FBY22_0382 [Streptomyces sp. SLBN-31]